MPLRGILLAGALLALTAGTAAADPAIVSAPYVDEPALVGVPLRASPPLVDEASELDVTLLWERSTDGGFEAIPDAVGAVYTPTLGDLGRRLRVRAVLETAAGSDTGWSDPSEPVGVRAGGRLRIGPEPQSPVRLARWIVTAGEHVRVAGSLGAGAADARLVLEPVTAGSEPIEVPVAVDELGRVDGEVQPAVNAVAWLELGAGERIRMGVVGVRPRIGLLLGARRDGRDAAGRQLIRDLRILAGSAVEPGIAGMRLTWEGMLPGDRTGTAVCRSDERVVSGPEGVLRGGCRTRGAWASARWRLVLEPATAPLSSPYLPARSAWVRPRVGGAVPVLPRRAAGGGGVPRVR